MSQLSDPSCTSHQLLEPLHRYEDSACSLDFRQSLLPGGVSIHRSTAGACSHFVCDLFILFFPLLSQTV